jgi:hypothetical protein
VETDRLDLPFIETFMKKSTTSFLLLYVLFSLHLLAVVCLFLVLPSIPTGFADETWVNTSIAHLRERAVPIDEFVSEATHATSILQESAMTYLIGFGVLSLFSVILTGGVIFLFRRIQQK